MDHEERPAQSLGVPPLLDGYRMVSDPILEATSEGVFTEEVVQTAFAMGLITESQLVRIAERRMAAGMPLTERETSTALRLRDEIEAVAEDWRSEAPIRVRDLLDTLSSASLRAVLVLLVASLAEQIPENEDAVWEIETILDSLDVDGVFERDRFFSPESRKTWRNGEGIWLAALREARMLA